MERNSFRVNLTSQLKHQTYYTLALNGEFRDRAFSEERAPEQKGKWREVFAVEADRPVDLEIGTGTGYHFQHHALKHPERCLIGIEIKYKPLIQTIRRTVRAGAKNAAVIRFHAFETQQIFTEGELNDIYIHFPDPWTSPRKPLNRIVQKKTLEQFYKLQRPGSKLEFKTDSEEAFKWCLEEIKETPYKIEFLTHDLHNSERALQNFETAFEKIFLRQGLKIHQVNLLRV